MFTENGAGLGGAEGPATLTSCPRKWVERRRSRWGVAIRAVAKVSDLSGAVVRTRVEAFWAYCRQWLAEEPDPNKPFLLSHLKELTGGAEITAQEKYGQPFVFKFQATIIIGLNPHDVPKID